MKRLIGIIASGSVSVFFTVCLYAAQVQDSTGKAGNAKGKTNPISEMPMDDSISFLKSLMALTFVLGLIFLATYLFKKLSGVKGMGFRTNRVPMHMIGYLPLGEKRFLSIVEIQGNHYFIGVSQDSIRLLSRLDLDLTEMTAGEEGRDFDSIFKKARALLQNRGKK